MTQEEKAASWLMQQKAVNPEGISNLETALEQAKFTGNYEKFNHLAQAMAHAIPHPAIHPAYAAAPKKHRRSFSFTITRRLVTGATELLDVNGNRTTLPVVAFLMSDYDLGASYRRSTNPVISASIVLLSVNPSADGKQLVFTYADAATRDTTIETVSISLGNTKSYLALLAASRNEKYTLKEPMLTIDSPLQTDMFSQAVQTLVQKGGGAVESDDFVPNQYTIAEANNLTAMRIKEDLPVDREHGFLFQMSPNVKAGNNTQANGMFWSANLNCFSDDLEKTGLH